MFINLRRLQEILNKIPSESIGEDVILCFDKTGFYLKGKNNEDTKELNNNWKWLITLLNQEAGVEEMLSVSDIAEHLRCSKATVYSILKDEENPKLPFIQTPKGIRIKSSDYFKFLNDCYIE